jgi:HSP20 family protein
MLWPVLDRALHGNRWHGLGLVHRDLDRVFDSMLRPRGREFLGGFFPSVNVVEGEKDIKVTVELPGMDEKDVDVTLSEGVVTIKGEKKEEHEDKGEGYHRIERSYGSFERSIPLPAEVEDEKAEAEFARGVLTVTVPKSPEPEKKSKKIEVKGE